MEYKYNVEVMRFKRSGKYYDTGFFETNSVWMHDISDEVHAAINKGSLSKELYYLLTGKDSDGMDLPNGYPVLIKGHL